MRLNFELRERKGKSPDHIYPNHANVEHRKPFNGGINPKQINPLLLLIIIINISLRSSPPSEGQSIFSFLLSFRTQLLKVTLRSSPDISFLQRIILTPLP